MILRVVSKLLIPFIMLFAVYVQFHGDFGPGGGFQAGVILAAALVFHALIFGVDDLKRVLPELLVERLMAIGVLMYLLVGVAGILLGGDFLDYNPLGSTPVDGQHRGIFWVELGVGITVFGVMIKFFYVFSERGQIGG